LLSGLIDQASHAVWLLVFRFQDKLNPSPVEFKYGGGAVGYNSTCISLRRIELLTSHAKNSSPNQPSSFLATKN